MAVTLRTFGSPILLGASSTSGGAPETDPSVLLRPGKPIALLVVLASAPARTASRAQLLDLLWADVEQERGLRTLRQTIFQLRQLLGADALQADARSVTLHAPLECDRDRFLDAATREDAPAMLEIRKAPFLHDFAVPGGAEFELWAELERARLDNAYLRVGTNFVRERIGAGDAESAIPTATALRAAVPEREGLWRLLLEAQLAAGAWRAAASELDALTQWLAREERDAEPATRELMRRVSRSTDTDPSSGSPPSIAAAIRASLIGRTREFSVLMRAAHEAQRGRRQYVHIRAGAGGGKSRLLQETRARLRATGQRVLLIQGTPGDQALALSFAADAAMALAAVPGAAGMSTEGAAVLVGIAPALSNRYPVAAAAPGADSSRVALALAELLSLVCDERPLTLLIDDLHWTDDSSRSVLRAALQRVSTAPLLVVGSARPGTDPLVAIAPVLLDLPALTSHEVEALVRDMALLPDAAWSASLPLSLARATDGNPLLLLETLQLARERGALCIVDGVWTCPDGAVLAAVLTGGEVLRRRLDDATGDEWTLLTILAVRGMPTSWSLILDTRLADAVVLAHAAESLTRRGLIHRDADSLSLVHDRLMEAVLDGSGIGDVVAAHRGLGHALANAWVLSSQQDERTVPRAVAHLLAADDTVGANRLAREWVRHRRSLGDRRPARAILMALLGVEATTGQVDQFEADLAVGSRRAVIVLTAGLLVLLATAVIFRAVDRPARLVVVTAPIARNPLLVPAPVVQVLDAMGRLRESQRDTVWVAASPGTQLTGEIMSVTEQGRAVFRNLNSQGGREGKLQFRLSRDGAPMAETPVWFGEDAEGSSLHLVRGTINGIPVEIGSPFMRVAIGDSVRADLVIRYTSRWAAASIVLGATGTWGDPASAHVPVVALVTPALGVEQRVRFTLPVTMPAGRHALILAFHAEDNVGQVMSGTNWQLGRQQWGDGNDVARWTLLQRQEARERGRVLGRVLRLSGYQSANIPAVAVELEAVPR